MKTSLTPRKATEVQLPARSLLRMEGDGRGVRVLCRSGLCWITQEGDSKDYLLEHKQNFTIHQNGVVVVQALADTEILVRGRGRVHVSMTVREWDDSGFQSS